MWGTTVQRSPSDVTSVHSRTDCCAAIELLAKLISKPMYNFSRRWLIKVVLKRYYHLDRDAERWPRSASGCNRIA
jgi:hypothetical protein